MEEKDTEENDEDHGYILSLLENVKSPNRFSDCRIIGNSESISSNSSAAMDDDSNTSESFSHSSSYEFPGEQLMDNFNRVKTGHKLDDYILGILKSDKCKKRLCFESQTASTNSFLVSDSSMDAIENMASPDSLEVSDILNKHGLPSHKLDDVLHVALKIVKPLNTEKKMVRLSEEGKSMMSICIDKGNCKSTSMYTCHLCNFNFNSEDNRNKHMANKHHKRFLIRGHHGKLRRNTSKSCNNALETCESYCDLDKLGKHKNSVVHSNNNDHVDEHPPKISEDFCVENRDDSCTILKTNKMSTETEDKYSDVMDDDYRDFIDDQNTSDSYSCRRVEITHVVRNYDPRQCCRTRTFSEHMTLLNKQRSEKAEENSQCMEIVDQGITESSSRLSCQERIRDTEAKFTSELINYENCLSLEVSYCSGIDEVSTSSSPCSSSKQCSSLQPPLSSFKPSTSLSSNHPPVSPQLPEMSTPDTLLREKHWIILDTPNSFEGPFYSDVIKQQGIQTKSEDIFGIKSIDDSSKNKSLAQSFVPFTSDSLDNSSVDISNLSSRSNPLTVQSSTSTDSVPKDVYISQEQGSGNINEEFNCARHLTFSDYLSNYHLFKRLTFKTESLACDASAFSPHNMNTPSRLKNKCSANSQDYILSPPKKRWKSYLSGD